MFCTGKEQLTCNSEKMGCEGCYYNDDKNKDEIKMENLIEELTKVNPANLSEEGLKLFNKINEIIDRNEELEKQMGKDLDVVYLQGVYNEKDRWKSKVREKIEKAKEYEKEVKTIITVNGTYYIPSSAYYKILQKGYSELLQEGDK